MSCVSALMAAKTVQFCYSFYKLHWINLPHHINSWELSTFATTHHFHKRKIYLETTKRYNLNLITMNGKIKDARKTLKKTQPSIKAILLSARRHDPFSDTLCTFSPTDPVWPHYMRVNPILDWHHANVWSFIRECKVPYRSLYDEGYTSLVSSQNTNPNPALKYDWPAYMLEDGLLERAGRD